MNQTTVTVPNWLVDAIHLAQRNWIAFVGTVLLCVITIAVTAIVKGHVNIKREEARAKAFYVRFTALFAAALSIVGSLAYFISENMPVLKNIPYIGENILTVFGGIWTLYQLGLKFKVLEAKGTAWALKSNQTSTASQTTEPTQSDSFLNQP